MKKFNERFAIISWIVLFISIGIFLRGDFSLRHSSLFNSISFKAEKAAQDGKFDIAFGLYRQYFLGLSEKEDQRSRVDCLIKLGILSWNIGGLNDSTKFFDDAWKSIVRNNNFDKEEHFCRIALEIIKIYQNAKKARESGSINSSIKYFDRAIKLSRSIGSLDHELKCLRQLSICYWDLNQLKRYYELNLQAKKIAQKIGHRKEEGICLNNLGIYYWKISDYSNAINCYDRALKISEIVNDGLLASQALSNLSLVYNELGEYESALKNLERVENLTRKLLKSNIASIDFNNKGIIQKNLANSSSNIFLYYSALESFKNGLEIAQANKNYKIVSTLLLNIGDTYHCLEDFNLAISYYKRGIDIARKINELEILGILFMNCGNVCIAQKDFNSAINYFNSSIKITKELEGGNFIWESFFGLGKCYENLGKYNLALKNYKESIKIIERIREHIFVDIFKTGFNKNKTKVYENLINLLLNIGDHEPSESINKEIFLFIEKAKARAFIESMAEVKIGILGKLDSELKNEEERISRKLTEIYKEISRPASNYAKRQEIHDVLEQTEDSYNRLVSRIRATNQAAGDLISPDVCNVTDLQKRILPSNAVLIEYFLMNSRSLMAIIDSNGLTLYSLPPITQIQNSIKGYLKILSGKISEPGIMRIAAQRIFSEILYPLKNERYANKKKLIIIPDGPLYFLPFETLLIESPGQKIKYLIELYEVSYVPSASALKYLASPHMKSRFSGGLLAVGNPLNNNSISLYQVATPNMNNIYEKQNRLFNTLVYSREEILKISKYFPRHKKIVLSGPAASEEAVKAMDGREFEVIHFACHSYLDEEKPMKSALVLSASKTGTDDGLLQVRELYNLKLSAELVVLSSCLTARGRLESFEGVIGLPRIFFYSGAKSVLSTLWQIEDRSTVLFMNQFYKRLSEGYSKAKSLQLAKIDLIQSGFTHPQFWGAFILNGYPWSSIEL